LSDALSRPPDITPREEAAEQATIQVNLNYLTLDHITLNTVSLVPMHEAPTPPKTDKKARVSAKDPKSRDRQTKRPTKNQTVKSTRRSPPLRTPNPIVKRQKLGKAPPGLTSFETQLWQLQEHPLFLTCCIYPSDPRPCWNETPVGLPPMVFTHLV
jgi:hypothetical protein